MNKLEMAHDWAIARINSGVGFMTSEIVEDSWKYADAMQAEADKREKQKAIDDAESSKVLFEKLTDSRSLTKDEHGNCLHFHREFGHKKCMDCGADLKLADSPQLKNESILHDIDCYFDNANNTKRDADNLIQSIYEHLTGEVRVDAGINDVGEWQPDWSQAPDWAVAWAMDMSGECYWHSGSREPKVDNHIFESSADGHTFEAPSFGYKGKWKESLRKRPNT